VTMKKVLFAVLSFAFGLALAGAEFAKVQNCRIVIPEKASAVEKAAAAELKLHLTKSLTAPVKLNGKVPGTVTFFVGDSPEAAQAGLKAPKGEYEFGILRKGDAFLLYGKDTPKARIVNTGDDCGTFLSAAYFARKYLGTQVFLPGPEGMKHAKNPEIRFPGDKDEPRPAYEARTFQTTGKGVPNNEMALYFRRRLGNAPAWTRTNHYYKFLNSWNKRFKDKPELFALHEGRRVCENYPRHFPCTSNPEVLKQVVADLTAAIKKNPRIYSIRLFSDAPVRSCECASCRNSPAGKLVKGDDNSETVYAFFCRIAREMQKVKPDLAFHTQTKGESYYIPPRTEKLPPHCVVAVLTGHFIRPDYAKSRELCSRWRKAGARVMIYSYPRAPEMKNFPVMNPHRVAEYFREFNGAASGSRISEGRGNVPWTFSALNTYVQSAVMFDPSLDGEKLIDEFCALAAPNSAKELKAFYTAMEQLLDGAKFRDDPRFNCYTLDRLKGPRTLLDKAVAKDPANKFVQQLSKDFADFEAEIGKTAAAVARYKALLAAYEKTAPQRKLVKLSPKGVTFSFIPVGICENFAESTVTVSAEKGCLKFRAVCNEPVPEKPVAFCKESGVGVIWSDDVVELFLGSPDGPLPYIHTATNINGIFRAQLHPAQGEVTEIKGFPLKAVGRREKDKWILEITIPVSALKQVVKNGRLKIGVSRARTRVKGENGGQLSYIQKGKNFHDEGSRIPVQLP